eukprot:3553526-Amphidinium_carterae.1
MSCEVLWVSISAIPWMQSRSNPGSKSQTEAVELRTEVVVAWAGSGRNPNSPCKARPLGRIDVSMHARQIGQTKHG